jgi:hypothetical protein
MTSRIEAVRRRDVICASCLGHVRERVSDAIPGWTQSADRVKPIALAVSIGVEMKPMSRPESPY